MKKFLKKISWFALAIVGLMFLLDVLYTAVYTMAEPRNKVQYLIQLKNTNIDYVFLGSSRTFQHISTRIVEQQTGKTAINLGMDGIKPDDVYFQLQMLVHNKVRCEKAFIQVDYSYNTTTPSDLNWPLTLPFIRTNPVVNRYLQQNPNYNAYYFVPFYRYLVHDYAIGFRTLFSMLAVKNKNDYSDGFSPRDRTFNEEMPPELPHSLIDRNDVFDKIDSLCLENNIEPVYFIAPYCEKLRPYEYNQKLLVKFPKIKDYSATIFDTKYFYNCLHLNKTGAEMFTRLLIDDCLKNP